MKTVYYRRLDMPGAEVVQLDQQGDEWRLSGTALIAYEHRPIVANYSIICGGDWKTQSVDVVLREDNKERRLVLGPDSHEWIKGSIDVDLGFTPSTNLLPVRRLDLPVGGSAEVRAAWVRFPDLELLPLEQRYTRLETNKYLYESAGGKFRRELEVDDYGFVMKYPDFWVAEK
ncbi:MAG TPA: putative glycolipid-binding domain-containing protein [Gemmatimonadaceae bacterium]|nr:putative glycolipid-binding domain-containing protein [Gemmatimonadaceae bacterium]